MLWILRRPSGTFVDVVRVSIGIKRKSEIFQFTVLSPATSPPALYHHCAFSSVFKLVSVLNFKLSLLCFRRLPRWSALALSVLHFRKFLTICHCMQQSRIIIHLGAQNCRPEIVGTCHKFMNCSALPLFALYYSFSPLARANRNFAVALIFSTVYSVH